MSIFEVLTATFIAQFNWSRRNAVLLIGLAAFVFGIPSALAGANEVFPSWQSIYGKNFFDTVDYISNNWLLPISGVLIAIFAGWYLKKELLFEEYMEGTRMQRFFSVWFFLVRWVAPLAVLAVLLQKGGIIDVDTLFQTSSL
jgi:NSS family neurotransmitter:Na+ symporter